MMYAMNVRRDDNFREDAVNAAGQTDVRVMKLNDRKQNAFVNDDFGKADSENQNEWHTNQRGERNFAEMKARGRRDIEIAFGVMHAMKAPEKMNAVVQPMPGIHPGIENQKRGDDSRPCR